MNVTMGDFFLAKLETLAVGLEAVDIPCQVVGMGCDLPVLELYFSGGSTGICTYIYDENTTFSQDFLITLETELEPEDCPRELLQPLCNHFNATSLGGTALLNVAGDGLIFRAVLPDNTGDGARAVFHIFVKVYESYLLKLEEMLKKIGGHQDDFRI
ncbi:MAG: hypothetical protein R3Y62_02565 [Eubacteriales bacterium]